MPNFQNNPQLNGGNTLRRYVHQPLSVDHYGIHAKIQENGKVLISCASSEKDENGDVLVDEVEIPASLVFKLAQLLKATRSIQFVSVGPATEMQEG